MIGVLNTLIVIIIRILRCSSFRLLLTNKQKNGNES